MNPTAEINVDSLVHRLSLNSFETNVPTLKMIAIGCFHPIIHYTLFGSDTP